VRGCDSQGCGYYRANRKRGGMDYEHQGADYVSVPGQSVRAITGGVVDRIISGKYDGLVVDNGKGTIGKLLYVDVASMIPAAVISSRANIGNYTDGCSTQIICWSSCVDL
jgi:hypothetical protein